MIDDKMNIEENLKLKLDDIQKRRLIGFGKREFSGQINILINKDLHKKLIYYSILNNCSLTMLVELYLEQIAKGLDDVPNG